MHAPQEGGHRSGASLSAGASYMYPFEAIGSGSLALHPRIACGWVSRIAEEFSVIAFNSRPDAVQKEAKILVAFREGKEQMTIHNGKAIFLQERKEGKGLNLADAPTSLWIKPLILDNGNVLIEAGRKLIGADGVCVTEEKGDFIAYPVRSHAALREGQSDPLGELKGAHYIGPDPLIVQYGGNEYAAWREKIKIAFVYQGRSYACFLTQGDMLQYKNGEWRAVSQEEISPRYPLARVDAATAKGVSMRAWDETGFSASQVAIEAQKIAPSAVMHDLLPSGLRLRSSSQVSCLLGKKRLIVKKGDWLLRTASGWRSLRRADEIEDCLYHRLKGELLILDTIEKQQGKWVLAGHLFDELRTQSTPISLPIDTEKKGSQKPYRRGRALAAFPGVHL
jgi:hypothetical protein